MKNKESMRHSSDRKALLTTKRTIRRVMQLKKVYLLFALLLVFSITTLLSNTISITSREFNSLIDDEIARISSSNHYLSGNKGIQEVEKIYNQGGFRKVSFSVTHNGEKLILDKFHTLNWSEVEIYKAHTTDIFLVKDVSTNEWINDVHLACQAYYRYQFLNYSAYLYKTSDELRELQYFANKIRNLTTLYDSVNLVKNITVSGGKLFFDQNPVGKASSVIDAFSQIAITLVRLKRAELVTHYFTERTREVASIIHWGPESASFDELATLYRYHMDYDDLVSLFTGTFYEMMGSPDDLKWANNLWKSAKGLAKDVSSVVGVSSKAAKMPAAIVSNSVDLIDFANAAANGNYKEMIRSFTSLLMGTMGTTFDHYSVNGTLDTGSKIADSVLSAFDNNQLYAKSAEGVINFLLEFSGFSNLLGINPTFPNMPIQGVVAGVNWVNSKTTSDQVKLYQNFGITIESYDETANWNEIVYELFGSQYRVADWNDLVRYHAQGGDLLELFDSLGLTKYKSCAFVTRNGNPRYGGDRYYFASRHEHNKPSNYLAHQNINNYLISLGSWRGSRPILVVKK